MTECEPKGQRVVVGQPGQPADAQRSQREKGARERQVAEPGHPGEQEQEEWGGDRVPDVQLHPSVSHRSPHPSDKAHYLTWVFIPQSPKIQMGYTQGTCPQVGGAVLPYLQVEGALFLSLPLAGRAFCYSFPRALHSGRNCLSASGRLPQPWCPGSGFRAEGPSRLRAKVTGQPSSVGPKKYDDGACGWWQTVTGFIVWQIWV